MSRLFELDPTVPSTSCRSQCLKLSASQRLAIEPSKSESQLAKEYADRVRNQSVMNARNPFSFA